MVTGLFPDETEQLIASAGYFVIGVDGSVSWSSAGLDWWLTEQRVRQIEDKVRHGSNRIVLHHNVVEPTDLLDGQILCKVKPVSPVRAEPLAGAVQRQRDIASLLGSGATNNEIADLLGVSPGSVRSMIRGMCKRFEVSSRVELIAVLRELRRRV